MAKNYDRLLKEARNNDERISIIAESIDDEIIVESQVLDYAVGLIRRLLRTKEKNQAVETIAQENNITADQFLALPEDQKSDAVLKAMGSIVGREHSKQSEEHETSTQRMMDKLEGLSTKPFETSTKRMTDKLSKLPSGPYSKRAEEEIKRREAERAETSRRRKTSSGESASQATYY